MSLTTELCGCGRGKFVEPGRDTCFNCRVSSVGYGFAGGAVQGRQGWNTSKKEWMQEHLGTTDDRELAKRGIERADS